MKFSKKKLLITSLPIAILSPSFFVISCSKETTKNYNVSSNNNLYSNIWNLSVFDVIKNSIFNMTINDLENQINNSLKNDSKNNLIMKTYCFYFLWNAIKNPYTSSGSVQTNLSTNISNFSTFLSTKLEADDTSVTINDKKTYKNFKNYLNTFDYKISILNFENESIDNSKTLREVISNDGYQLNFKLEFWTSDSETHEKMIDSKNESIMFKNSLTRKQRETLKKIKDPELKKLVTTQFNYLSTKLYYDVENKKFNSIIMPSNIYSSSLEETPDSGYASGDKSRELFFFDWYSDNESSTSFDSYLVMKLNSTNYFSTSISSDWTNFLKKEEIVDTSDSNAMNPLKINLNKVISFDESDYE